MHLKFQVAGLTHRSPTQDVSDRELLRENPEYGSPLNALENRSLGLFRKCNIELVVRGKESPRSYEIGAIWKFEPQIDVRFFASPFCSGQFL